MINMWHDVDPNEDRRAIGSQLELGRNSDSILGRGALHSAYGPDNLVIFE